jgi:8-oxo-dGTP pyrophosphatase MutT (NUDIX family)
VFASAAAEVNKSFTATDYDLVGSKRSDGSLDWFNTAVASRTTAFALTILCLRDISLFPGMLILQKRTPANSTSNFGLYSNVSGRLRLHDTLLANDIAHSSGELTNQAFRYAAARELLEETGFDVDDEQLTLHDSFRTPIGEKEAECRIFLGGLDLSNLGAPSDRRMVKKWLAERDLYPFDRPTLTDLIAQNKVNTVLAMRWSTSFSPLLTSDQ